MLFPILDVRDVRVSIFELHVFFFSIYGRVTESGSKTQLGIYLLAWVFEMMSRREKNRIDFNFSNNSKKMSKKRINVKIDYLFDI